MLYLLLWPIIFATAYRILRGDRGLAADAGQEVFLRLYRYARFEEFIERPDSFPAYALTICKNVSRNYLSKILREPSVSEDTFQESLKRFEEGRSRDVDNPELAAIRSDELSTFLSTLDSEDRHLAELLLNGADTSSIAQRLGLRYATAAVRIHRLRKVAHNSMKTS